ncbi:MAG TPA: GAF domain-containing protein [Kofleriaceae bacterium]|nr:GAF domain-containing protein [Kofleriaceae bacterium]
MSATPIRGADPSEVENLREQTRALQHELEARKRLEAELRDALEARSVAQAHLEALHRIGQALHAELDLEKVVQRLTDEATALCHAEFGAFFYNVVAESGESYMLYTLAGVPREAFAGFPMPRNTPVFAPTFSGECVVRLDDVTRDARYGHNPPHHGMPRGHLPVRSYLAVPVVARFGEVLGGLFFGHSQPGVFTERDEAAVVAVAAHAAAAIENARLYESQKRARALAEEARSATEEARQRTERLQRVTNALARAIGPEDAARIVIREIRELLGMEAGGVFLFDATGTQIERSVIDADAGGAGEEQARTMDLSTPAPICDAARTGELIWVVGEHSIECRYPNLAALRERTRARTWGGLPITFEGRTLGAIGLRGNAERALGEDERAFLLAVGRQCGQAIERARLDDATQAARADAEQANRSKDEFLAMLGHELRNPLSPILTAVQLMRIRGDSASAREQSIIERQVNHLIRLVDDLLDISRITRGKVELSRKPIEVAALLARTMEIVAPVIEERKHRLELALPGEEVWLEGDELRLCQVLTNLLTNAAKYTDPGGTIQLRAERVAEGVVIAVKDNGIGIVPELLPRVFDLFVQGYRSPERRQGGLGIGLALVQNLVHMHGGSVSASSPGPGGGSEFSIRLPVLELEPVAAPRAPGERIVDDFVRITGRRILVVDDNEDAASLLGDMLRSIGHDVRVAHQPSQALAMLARFDVEVAILDIGLPEMDGYELAIAMRERLGSTARLIAVTGYGQDQDRARAEQAGFDAHFAKPVSLAQLIADIELSRGAAPKR